MKKIANKLVVSLLVALILLTGCWDSVELENRGFVISLGIDKADDTGIFELTMELPEEGNNKETVTGKIIKSSQGTSITKAITNVDMYTSKTMHFGHTKIAIFGKGVLEDETLVEEAIDALLRSREFSRKLIILTCKDDAHSIISEEIKDETTMGIYISNFYKKNNDSINYRQNLDDLSESLTQNGFAVIPEIHLEGGQLKMGGAVVLKGYALKGWLDDSDIRGYLWAIGKGSGASVTDNYNDGHVALSVDKQQTDISFFEEDEKVSALIKVEINGVIEEFPGIINKQKLDALKKDFEQIISEEICKTHSILYEEFETDGYNLLSLLKKENPDLYKTYASQLGENGENIPISTSIEVAINSLGSIK